MSIFGKCDKNDYIMIKYLEENCVRLQSSYYLDIHSLLNTT